MALVNPVILQIVGYQNSGKTTVITKIIKKCMDNGWKTVTIKHHGHGGKPAIMDQKDSAKHLTSGALASMVEGDGRVVLQADNGNYSLNEQIQLMAFFDPDIIIIEGHKQEKAYPKLLLLRSERDFLLLSQVDNIIGIVYWEQEMKNKLTAQINVPCFWIDSDEIIQFIDQFLMELVQNIDKKS